MYFHPVDFILGASQNAISLPHAEIAIFTISRQRLWLSSRKGFIAPLADLVARRQNVSLCRGTRRAPRMRVLLPPVRHWMPTPASPLSSLKKKSQFRIRTTLRLTATMRHWTTKLPPTATSSCTTNRCVGTAGEYPYIRATCAIGWRSCDRP